MEQQEFINVFLPKYLWINLGFWETAHLPLPKPSFCPKWEVSVNFSLGEG